MKGESTLIKINPMIFLILLPMLIACNSCSTANNKVENNIEDSEYNEDPSIEYVTLPNGSKVDARIPEDVIDRMFKRIEAIENGDLVSFRATLGEMQDGVDYNYQLHLIFTYFGDLFDIDPDVFYDAVANGGEEFTEIARTLFNSKPPLKSRNTGLFIKRLETTSGGGLKVIVKNNKNEESIYYFIYY
jgi:hypothetical protein